MFSRVRKRLTFTNVALTLALVFAMTGGAYAAKKYVITSTKQISPSVLKALQGKAGAPGAAGAQGPAGPVGPAGAGTKGERGEKGESGSAGSAGSHGATGSAGTQGETGATGLGGQPGQDGKTGPTGATGTAGATGQTGFTETLPAGKTETGTWGASGAPGPTLKGLLKVKFGTVSFTIPLAEPVAAYVIKANQGEGESEESLPEEEVNGVMIKVCKGTYEAPIAERGHLCIFVDDEYEENIFGFSVKNIETGKPVEAGKDGAIIEFTPVNKEEGMTAIGSWTVTAK